MAKRRYDPAPVVQPILKDSQALVGEDWRRWAQQLDSATLFLLNRVAAIPPENVVIYDNGFSDTVFGDGTIIIDFGDSTSG